jgi:chromosome segregation ATPase
MNTTVKVFIIINLLLALAFCWIQMTLFATRENWKRRWHEDTTELAAELKAADQQVINQSAEKVKAQNLVKSLEVLSNDQQAKIKDLENTVTQRDKDIQLRSLEISQMKADIQGLMEENKTLSTTLESTRTRNTELTHIASVGRAAAFQLNVKLAEVEDDFHNATTELQKRYEDIAKLTKDLNDNKARLALVRERHPDVWSEIYDEKVSAKFLQGVVAAVRKNPQGQQDLVMLTVGKEAGIEEGMEFIVFRGNQYVVKVRAERVLNDMVACRVIPDSWNSNGVEIQQGDLAQNRL